MKNLDLDILRKKIQGSLSVNEEIEFGRWIESSDENRAYFERMSSYYAKPIEKFDLETVPNTTELFLQRLHKKSRIVFLRKLLPYAAVVLLPLVIGTFIWISSHNRIDNSLEKLYSRIENTDQTVLITSNGKAYQLESGIDKAIVEDQGVKIRKYMRAGLKYEKQKKNEINQEAYNVLRTASGDNYKVELSDGSIVYLNGDSELRYPVSFGKKERKVELKGEAFFDINKTGYGFYVETEKVTIQVMGTRFNVKAYRNENEIQTTLVSGKVKMIATDDLGIKSVVLKPGTQARWYRNTHKLESRKVDTDLYTSWVDGYFRFENQRLEEVMREIARWYDVKVFYQDAELKNKRLTGKIYRMKDFNIIARMIEKTSGIKIVKDQNAILITMR